MNNYDSNKNNVNISNSAYNSNETIHINSNSNENKNRQMNKFNTLINKMKQNRSLCIKKIDSLFYENIILISQQDCQ